MTRNVHRSAVIALALASGCAGASMSRSVDDDGGLASGDESSEGSVSLSATDPSGDPTTAPSDDSGTTDGADGDPSATADEESTSTLPGSSSGEPASESSTGDASTGGGDSSSSEGTPVESSSDDAGETSPADDVDLSGYTLVQTDSDRELVLPDGTLVPVGGCLVVGRNAAPGAFQTFWDMNWGDEVVYIDGNDDFPSINGDETFSLRSAADVLLDGPTPAIEAGTAVWRMDADDADGWQVDMTADGSTPGISDAVGGSSGTPYLSEYSDPTGAGNFDYEFVEICIAP